ncbi:polysaccharide biosynthesis/export family protein [Mesonia mobilis]|uniref:polysaccharide biosynthesis/export family protein n=2 Tax=Mesonia mobilis TaxID=369791 RepID=UPI0026F2E71D|nr:polysaccharide biosynthesis/export family protein [Mesonia mobilis]
MKKILLLLSVSCLIGCASRKDVVRFQDADNLPEINIDSIYHHPEIQVNDILKIDLTALEPESLMPFQFEKSLVGNTGVRQIELLKLEGYLVNKKGVINYPGLGEVMVGGKTTQEVQSILKEELSRFVKDVDVKVRLVNFKFTVMGEVKAPGTYTISEETVTLPQALGMAGDLTIQGERKNVLIFRNDQGVITSKRIDLTSTAWMDSPYYYLKQNDMVYVEPNNPRVKSAGFIGNVGNVISVVSILMSAAVLIFR